MTDPAANTDRPFEAFPSLGGVGWRPALAIGVCGGAVGAALALAIVYPAFASPTDGINVVTWWTLLGAIIAAAIGATVNRWEQGRTLMWIRLSAGATAAVAAAAALGFSDSELWIPVLAVAWAPGAVLHRSYLADVYPRSGLFRVLAMYWAGAALGAALPLWFAAGSEASWQVALGITAVIGAVGLIATLGLPHDDPDTAGIKSAKAGWGRRSRLFSAAAGVLAVVGVHALLVLMIEDWNIDARGRLVTLASVALVLGGVLLAGHWYHGLTDATSERLADAARLLMVLGGLLLTAAAFSRTLIGLVVTAVAGATTLGIAAVVVDTATLGPRTSDARRTATGSQLWAFIVGGTVAAFIVAGPLSDWTADSVLLLAVVPMLVVGAVVGWGARKKEVTDSDAVRNAEIERTAIHSDSLLNAQALDVAYGTIQVIFDVDFAVRDREIVALLGTNGAGKTTLLKTLAGLIQPSAGRIVFGGADITEFEATWATELGVCHIAGADSIASTLTVDENLRMFAYPFKGKGFPLKDRLDEVFEVFPRLLERHDQRASTLSGGEKQMLALAKAIIQRPRLLLIDEFSLGLAPRIVAELIPVVERINDAGTAVVIVEQNVATALSIADRAYVIEKGEVLWSGAASVLEDDPSKIETMYLSGTAAGSD
ncbi:MAG: ATP-binding cassette domain-containing protein [Acidimicrobiia bacterium]